MTDELSFANDMRFVSGQTPSPMAWLCILFICVLLLTGGFWANWAVLEEVTSGEGKVVPTSRLQVVQASDGGIIRAIDVRDGDLVEKDQILLTLDDRDAKLQLGELLQRRMALKAQILRLTAEAEEKPVLVFPPELVAGAPEVTAAELASFLARRAKMQQDTDDLQSELLQHEQEMREMEAQQRKLAASLAIMNQELEMSRKLSKSGAIPEIDLLRLERQTVEAKGELEIIEASLPRLSMVVDQALAKVSSSRKAVTASVREELAKTIGVLGVLEQSIRAVQLRIARTELRAPVRGIVNRLSVTSIGAVVQPGSSIVEIVPADDTLVIEVRIGPKDIGFITKGQAARVKLTAFDYLQYGWFDGTVIRIGADTLVDAENHPYYMVTVTTEANAVTRNNKFIRVIPGMVATVDILTGQKSVLQYLLSPVLRAKNEALRER